MSFFDLLKGEVNQTKPKARLNNDTTISDTELDEIMINDLEYKQLVFRSRNYFTRQHWERETNSLVTKDDYKKMDAPIKKIAKYVFSDLDKLLKEKMESAFPLTRKNKADKQQIYASRVRGYVHYFDMATRDEAQVPDRRIIDYQYYRRFYDLKNKKARLYLKAKEHIQGIELDAETKALFPKYRGTFD